MVLQVTNRVLAAAEIHVAAQQGINNLSRIPSELSCDKISLVDRSLPNELALVEGNNNSLCTTPEDYSDKYLDIADVPVQSPDTVT